MSSEMMIRVGPTVLSRRVAVLYQAVQAPVIHGIRKPVKPGGYADSGADIAHALRSGGLNVVTPTPTPDPAKEMDWVFADDEAGIRAARSLGAEVLWANTVLFEGHPLEAVMAGTWVVGQLPARVQMFDDKWSTNAMLRQSGCPVAPSLLLGRGEDIVAVADLTERLLAERGLHFPLVVKPVRGRGSQGVSRVSSLAELVREANALLGARVETPEGSFPVYGDSVIVEQFLEGRELTVTVLPPGSYEIAGVERTFETPWALPPMERFNHRDGIAPYNGVVAVVNNSKVLPTPERNAREVETLLEACAHAAEKVGALAPIRIDCRQDGTGGFLMFDLNMKPNMTGAGRPGRDEQDSLTALAARAIGWSYTDLLVNMLRQAWTCSRR